jgi:hypothetical protein
MAGELHDLDAWLEEEERQAPRVKLFGEQVTLPAEPPFDLILRVYRLLEGRGKDADLDPEAMAEVLGLIYGPKRVQGWRARGLGVRRMEKLARVAMDYWQLGSTVDAAEDAHAKEQQGEAPAPEGSGPSSPTGPLSSPISNGSTGSTSTPNGDGSGGGGSGSSWPASAPIPGSPWPSPATTPGG